MAAARAIPTATARARPRTCWPRSCGSTSTGRVRGPTTAIRIPATNPFRGADLGPRRGLGVRPAQSVADLVRSRDWRCCSSPTSARAATRRSTASLPATRAAGTTAGASWRAGTVSGRHRMLARRATRPGRRIRPRVDQLLDHRRLRLPGPDPAQARRVRTSSPTSAAAGSGRCPPPGLDLAAT